MVPRHVASVSPQNLLAIQPIGAPPKARCISISGGGPRDLGANNPPGHAEVCSNGSDEWASGGPTAACSPLTRSHYTPQVLTYPSTLFPSLLPLPTLVQVTAHLDDCEGLLVGVTNASPLSPNPVSTWKLELSFENTNWVVPVSCLGHCNIFSFPPVQGHYEEFYLHLLGSATASPPPIQESTGSEKEETHLRSILKRAASITPQWEET